MLCRVNTMNMTSLFVPLILLLICGVAVCEENEGMLNKIKKGLQYATNYLETARDIADLVSKSLGHKDKGKFGEEENSKPRDSFGAPNLVTAFFRLLGLDNQKIAAITVNSVVFLAQMISSLFGLKPAEIQANARNMDDTEPSWDAMKFVMENKNEKIQRLITQAQDEKLSSQLADTMDSFDTGCIRLLVCKATPVIRAAQNSLKNKTRANTRHISAWLPSREEFESNSDECEAIHKDCNLFPKS